MAGLVSHLRRNLVAYLALFVALGGTSYAAGTKLLPRNSVGSAQVINSSLLANDFKKGQLPRGARGAVGAPGAVGAQGAQGTAGAAGAPGTAGTAGVQGLRGATGSKGSTGNQGATGAAGPVAVRLNVTVPNGEVQAQAVGPFTVTFNCYGATAARHFDLRVAGSGGANLAGATSIDDGAANTKAITSGSGLSVLGQTIATIGADSGTTGHYYRLGGSLILNDTSSVTTVVFDMFLDDRGSSAGLCSFRGTAVSS